MSWDDDSLEYGYVVTRLADGSWWHLHFGRGGASYACELLGRPTDILACLQWFAAWAVAKSGQSLLTLDGERVESAADGPVLDFRWPDDLEATHFQRAVMPLLDNSEAFESAVREVVRSPVAPSSGGVGVWTFP